MPGRFIYVIFGGIVLSLVDNARILPRVKRQSLKVRITAKDDSIVLQYLSSIPVIKLQGYVLGLGGRFSRQNITLPGNGDPIEVDVDFNPKYLVAIHPVAEQNSAALGKKCKGSPDLHRPPQITIDPRTPTSVFLTWARSFKDKGFKVGKECENERQYTIRYREKERDKKWKYHLCPSSETMIHDLKPNTVYEFGIRVTKAKKDGVWSKPTTYTTTTTPQPRSSKNDQNRLKLNKVEVNFNSENPKHPRKPELPGMTNIKGIAATKKIAPNSAHNRTNWKLLPPKKPELSTKAIVGSQSTSNSADIQPGKSSSPKPVITSKPEHAHDFDKEGKKEETANIVSKPSMKGSKTRKENGKPAMKPLTTKVSKLSSSASPSTSSKSLLNSDRTEPEIPSSTIMPFITLRTTSDHKDVGNQDLPEIELPSSSNTLVSPSDITSALDSMETKTFSEPEMPATSSQLFDPISEPDDVDTQKIPDHEFPVTDIPNVIYPIPELESANMRETETTVNTMPSSNTPNLFQLISGYKPHATKPPNLPKMVPESEPANIRVTDIAGHMEPTSDTPSMFRTISGSKLQDLDTPNEFSLITESVPAKMRVTEDTADNAVPTSDTENVFTFPLSHELLVTDAINPIPEPQQTKISNTEVADNVVSTSCTPKVFALIPDHDLMITASPHVISPIPETEPAKIRDTEVAVHEVSISDVFNLIPDSDPPATEIPNKINPTPKSGEIGDVKVTDDEMPSSDFTAVVTLMPDHELPITDIPNMINPIPEPEHANIKDTEVTDHSVPHLTPDPELIVTDPSSVISPITETEHTKLRDTETADYRVKISDAAKVFTLIPVGELPATDTPNVNSPIPESEHVKIRDTEVTDHEPSTIETTKSSNPSHAYSTREKNLTDHKLPTSGTSHVSIPTLVSDHIEDKAFTDHELTNSDTSNAFSQAPISENSDTEDQEFKAPKATNSETSHLFSSTPRSELDNKEDKEMKDHKLPIQGTPNVFSQSQKSAHDNTEVEDLAALAESDSPSDNSPIIATNPIPETDAKVDQTEPETLSTVDQFPSTNYAKTPENPPVFRSTPVSNIDGQGQERFRGPYVKYMSKEKIPCSITESLKHFSEENITNEKALTAPRYPPSNLTLVTVEGCSSFLIVDWKSNKNDTASEYEVVSEMQGPDNKTEKLITLTNQTHAAVENLKPNTSYTFSVTPTNVHGRGPSSDPLPFVTESADPSVSEYIPGKDAIWTQYSFKFDSYSECQGKRFVKRTRYRKFVGIVLCNSLRYKIYLSNSLSGVFYNIGDLSGHGEDHCQFVDSFLDGRTGEQLLPEQLPIRQGFYRSVRQEPVMFGTIGGQTHINYVHWYECGISIPGQW